MVDLRRRVRFAINPPEADDPAAADSNGFAGVPAIRGLGRHYELEVVCRGDPDEPSGYLINIKRIDEAVREHAAPLIARACHETPAASPESLLPALISALGGALGSAPGEAHRNVASIRWRLSPFYSVEMERSDMSKAILRQSFEFAASHRLHVPELSDEENRRLFGKCNNPGGHGHNYRLEAAVEIPIVDSGAPFTLAHLERIVDERVINDYDHKHLNNQVSDFEEVNPSVEHIARAIYNRLEPAIREQSKNAQLREVTVWETEKTSCVYAGA
ncbi:MAG: 6-carboxytetrahydropterin synthase [Planctomycetota bacterium]|nr:6-carboxytetrahydropterin synthase [Planctomycetota bacterium]